MRKESLIEMLLPAAVFWVGLLSLVAEESAPAAAGPSTEETYALRFSLVTGAVKSLGWLQLKTAWRQKGSAPVVIEAESSTRINLGNKDRTLVKDPEASGGEGLAYVSELYNEIEIATPDRYQVWYRAYFPARGNWMHIEKMDDGELINWTDSDNGEDKKWLWVKGPVYDLAQGVHRYLFPSPYAWCGGARLDKIVLQSETAAAPVGAGPDAGVTEKQTAPAVELLSNRLNLEDMKSWRLELQKEDYGGAVEVFYSHDRGKTWLPLPAGAGFEVTPATKRVAFKVCLKIAPDGRSPRVRNLVLKGMLK